MNIARFWNPTRTPVMRGIQLNHSAKPLPLLSFQIIICILTCLPQNMNWNSQCFYYSFWLTAWGYCWSSLFSLQWILCKKTIWLCFFFTPRGIYFFDIALCPTFTLFSAFEYWRDLGFVFAPWYVERCWLKWFSTMSEVME